MTYRIKKQELTQEQIDWKVRQNQPLSVAYDYFLTDLRDHIVKGDDIRDFKNWECFGQKSLYQYGQAMDNNRRTINQNLNGKTVDEFQVENILKKFDKADLIDPVPHNDYTYDCGEVACTDSNIICVTDYFVKSGIDVSKYDCIIELGGGYGALANVILNNDAFKGRYIVFDFEDMKSIYEYYIQHSIEFLSNPTEISINENESVLLISTWGLSEMPFVFRDEILNQIKLQTSQFDYYLTMNRELGLWDSESEELQKKCSEEYRDNLSYFTKVFDWEKPINADNGLSVPNKKWPVRVYTEDYGKPSYMFVGTFWKKKDDEAASCRIVRLYYHHDIHKWKPFRADHAPPQIKTIDTQIPAHLCRQWCKEIGYTNLSSPQFMIDYSWPPTRIQEEKESRIGVVGGGTTYNQIGLSIPPGKTAYEQASWAHMTPKSPKFAIVMEDEQRDDFISGDKFIKCLLTKTVPIYWGAHNIDKYFNVDGIIRFDRTEQLQNIINNICNVLDDKYYENLWWVIEENYHIALEAVIKGKE
jgi:hypothetical protein